jgi:KaiC/GvpD/RAD55 family RecA-like ATPase
MYYEPYTVTSGNSHGLAIFFPDEKDKYECFESLYQKTTFAIDTPWDEFVKYHLSGCILTIKTSHPDTPVKVDKDLHTTDAYGKIQVFVLPDYHTINVTASVSTGPGSRAIFTQWNDSDISNPRILFVNEGVTLEAKYQTQYLLVVNTDPPRLSPQPEASISGPWYNNHTLLRCTAQNIRGKVFDYWTVNGANSPRGNNSIWITMDRPREAIAHYVLALSWWERLLQPETLSIIFGLVGAILVATLVGINTVRKRSLKQHAEPAAIEPPKIALPGRVSTGYEDLDRLLFGGIPEGYSVVLTAPSCDERDSLVRKFLEVGARNDEPTFYVTVDPGDLKSLAEKFQSNFHLFICNPQADNIIKSQDNVVKLKGVDNLTDISIALTSAFRRLNIQPNGPKRTCIEIVSDVLLQHHAVQTRRWLTDAISELKSRGFTTLAVMNPHMHPPEEVHAILDLFEGEINILEKETVKVSEKFLKIKKMHGQRYSDCEMLLRREKLET